MGLGGVGSVEVIYVPKKLVDEARRRGINVSELVLNTIANVLGLDPSEVTSVRLEFAEKSLREARKFIKKDPVQASEKLYKAVEKAMKSLVFKHGLRSIVKRVRKRGGWSVEDFFDAVSELREIYGDDIWRWWDSAWSLHV